MVKITTREEALEAVKQNGKALKYVPESLKTAELCLAAVKRQSEDSELRHSVSETFPLLSNPIFDDDYSALQYVPDNLKTAELCLMAVKQNNDALEYVPPELRQNIKDKLGL